MPAQRAIIIGAGIAGVAAAIALIRHNGIACSVYEIRSEPATIGGAINLTPNALRYLEHIGALSRLKSKGSEVKSIDVFSHRTGELLGKLNFDDIDRFKHRALRVMRNDLQQALLDTLNELGVQVQYDMRIQSVSEEEDSITAVFEDGASTTADFLLGCDGIHSAVRTKFLDPSRKPVYTGVANAYGFLNVGDLRDSLPIQSTSLYSGRFGSILLTYADATKSRLYVAAVMGTEDVGSREGWVAKGQDQAAMKQDFLRRFSGPTLPFFKEIIEHLESLTLFPVYKLSDHGKWTSGRMLLLGDAAHAMPPQGESVGLALEDVILLSRILKQPQDTSIKHQFQYYDKLRRPRIDAAVKAANFGFETIKDRGWITTIVVEWITWLYLWFMASKKQAEYAYDARFIELSPA